MNYVYATVFFFKESMRVRRQFRAGWMKFLIELPAMYWTFMRLEWNDQRRAAGYAPVTLKSSRAIQKFYGVNSNPRKGGRKKRK